MGSTINLERVSKTLGRREILKDVSFTVEESDIFGYLGPNGAGKTTTIRIILGLFRVDSGNVKVLGDDISQDSYRRKIGFVLETDGLYDNLDARENLDFYCQLYGVTEARRTEGIEEMLHLVRLQDRARDKVKTYSKGMRQKLALARAMVHDPELLVLDEPTAGVDPSGQMEVRDIILNLAHKKDKTIFLSSHNLDEVQRICNRIAVIDKGQIKICGELGTLRRGMGQQELIIETVAGTENKAEVLDKVISTLQKLPYVTNCYQETGHIHLNIEGQSDVSEIVAILSQNDIGVEQIKKSSASLEEIYAKAVREAER